MKLPRKVADAPSMTKTSVKPLIKSSEWIISRLRTRWVRMFSLKVGKGKTGEISQKRGDKRQNARRKKGENACRKSAE